MRNLRRSTLVWLMVLEAMAGCERGGGVVQPPPPRSGHYVSPTGSAAGDGSSAQPWDLATALAGAGGKVQPGDTIWVRGGTYAPTAPLVSAVAGAAGAPVVLRGYPGERAVLDAGSFSTDTVRRDFLIVRGDYTTVWGLEFTDSDPNRGTASRPNLLVNNGSHTRYVNLTIHDGGIGFFTYSNRTDVEVSGCIVYNNGWSVARAGNGHGLYVKSDAGPMVLRDNVLFDQFGFGIHAYTGATDGLLNNITVEGNTSFNNGLLAGSASGSNILVGGLAPADGIVVDANMTYFSPGVTFPNVWLGWSKSQVVNGSLQVRSNYIVGGAAVFDVHAWRSVTANRNTLAPGGRGEVVRLNDSSTTDAAGYSWGANSYFTDPADTAWSYHDTTYTFAAWRGRTGLGATDQATATAPATPVVFVRPNAYEPGRANIVVYNWGRLASVPANVAGVLQPGQAYAVWSVQALFGPPLASGVYSGESLDLPMTPRSPPVPVGLATSPAPATLPDFDVFLLTRAP
jgi:hypothetical protein